MTMMPIVPDYQKYPTGRDLKNTRGEIGLSGRTGQAHAPPLFIHKAKGRLGPWFIPE